MTQPGYSLSRILPHPSHKVRSSVRDDPLVPDQTHSAPIKHQTSRFTFITAFLHSGDLSHTRYKSFPQMITLLLTTHSPYCLSYSSFPHDVIPYCSPLIFLIFPIICLPLSIHDTRSVRSAYPKPFPLYSGSVLPVPLRLC